MSKVCCWVYPILLQIRSNYMMFSCATYELVSISTVFKYPNFTSNSNSSSLFSWFVRFRPAQCSENSRSIFLKTYLSDFWFNTVAIYGLYSFVWNFNMFSFCWSCRRRPSLYRFSTVVYVESNLFVKLNLFLLLMVGLKGYYSTCFFFWNFWTKHS